jgi:hypothetical protein
MRQQNRSAEALALVVRWIDKQGQQAAAQQQNTQRAAGRWFCFSFLFSSALLSV